MKIVAVGGGEIGRPGTEIETLEIDQEMIALTGKAHPKLLFVPTASDDSAGYVEVVNKYFGEKLGCEVDTLLLCDGTVSDEEIHKKIFSTDIVYVGGGNTQKMLRIWRERGVDALLRQVAEKGTVLAGVSAGAVCWFGSANSDSAKMIDPNADYVKIDCLGFFPFFVCPHFDGEAGRQPSVKKMLENTNDSCVAIDDCAAVEIVDDRFRVVVSKSSADAYVCFWKNGEYVQKSLKGDWQPMTTLRI